MRNLSILVVEIHFFVQSKLVSANQLTASFMKHLATFDLSIRSFVRAEIHIETYMLIFAFAQAKYFYEKKALKNLSNKNEY